MKFVTKLTAVATAGVLGAMAAAPADAIVPPRNCGTTTVNGKRYTVKADQLRCETARTYARTYLRSHIKPRYYRCEKGSSGSSLVARCVAARYTPDRTFWIIKKR